jgi:ATP-dependent DNA ligase
MRIMARRDGAGVRLITRQGNDFTARFPLIVAAISALPRRSFLIDGEAIVTNRERHPGIGVNEHYEADGGIVFQHACKLGCEGIVSKRLGSLYRSGRSPHWVKIKNPAAPAVRRETEEDWGR